MTSQWVFEDVAMDVSWFDGNVKPLLSDFSFRYSTFLHGDFGDLQRIEVEGFGKLGTVEFWSREWLGVDIYDLDNDGAVMNVLLSPDEVSKSQQVLHDFVRLMTKGCDI